MCCLNVFWLGKKKLDKQQFSINVIELKQETRQANQHLSLKHVWKNKTNLNECSVLVNIRQLILAIYVAQVVCCC